MDFRELADRQSAEFEMLCTTTRKIGWGGRIRTFTILINSEVSYRLDHAPVATIKAMD